MPRIFCVRVFLILALAIAESRVAQAQQERHADGSTTVHATKLTAPLRIDGTLDEALYETVVPISDFVQNDPVAGAPSTEKTEVWVAFDRENVYVAARCWDSQPDAIMF